MNYPMPLTGEIRVAHAGAPAPLIGDMIQLPGTAQPPNQPATPQPIMTIAGRPVYESDYAPGHAEQQRQPVQPQAPTVVGAAYEAIANASKAFGETFVEVTGNRGLNEVGQRAALAAFAETPAARSIETAEQAVADREAQARAEFDAQRAALVQPGDSAEELRNQRYLDRTKAKWEAAGSGATAAIRSDIASATPAQLGVLAEEVPAYLEAKGLPTDWLSSQFEQAAPELAAAQRKLHHASQARAVIGVDAAKLRNAMQRGTPLPAAALVDPRKCNGGNGFDPDRG